MNEFEVKTVKRMKELIEQFNNLNLKIILRNNRITKFPKMKLPKGKGCFSLKLYTPKLKSLKNLPVYSNVMNWVTIEEAAITKIETADECNVYCNYTPTVVYHSYTDDKDITISDDIINGRSGFTRIAVEWRQFLNPHLRERMSKLTNFSFKHLGGCLHNLDLFYLGLCKVPTCLEGVFEINCHLSYAEQKVVQELLKKELGELTLEAI